MNMKTYLSTVLSTLLLAGLASPTDARSAQEAQRPWTLMVYGAADNNADGPILEFLDRIRVALDDDPGMELVLFLDRHRGYSNDATTLGADFTGGRLFRLGKSEAEQLDGGEFFPGLNEGDTEVDSADPQNIGRFVAFCKERFPARKYALMIYSHADGQGMCPDEESGRRMRIPELTDWVGEEASVDFLALELCHMAGIEIAYQWRPGNGGFSADILLAIPNAGRPLDWDRALRRIRTPGHASPVKEKVFDPNTMTAADFGRLVIEEGHAGRQAELEEYLWDDPELAAKALVARHDFLREAAGCFDLGAVEDAKRAIDRLAVELARSDSKAPLRELLGSADDVQLLHYAREDQFGYRPYVDAYDLMERIATVRALPSSARTAALEARDAVDELVLASFGVEQGFPSFRADRNGIFILFPDGDAQIRAPMGRRRAWDLMDWYTPLEAADEHDPYGRWSFLADGAEPGNGKVENWFELLDSWFDDRSSGPEGRNRYAW